MNHKGYRSQPLSFNRRAVIASVAVTSRKSAIHSFTEVDITAPRRRIREHFERTGEKLSLTRVFRNVCLPANFETQSPRRNTEYSIESEYFVSPLCNSASLAVRDKSTPF